MLADDGVCRSEIDEWITDIVPKRIDDEYLAKQFSEATYQHDPEAIQGGLADPVWDLLDRGGKRWRALIFVTLVDGLGDSPGRYRNYACIPELLHNGTLVVDDIEDGATLRRGERTLHRRYGQDVALNVGNTLYFVALTTLSRNPGNLRTDTQLRVYDMVMEELASAHLGQAVDISWHNDREIGMAEEEYLEMCARKTGSLGRLSARLAAIVTDQPEPVERSLAAWAQNLSIAFQISDDVLDIENTMGDLEAFGKEYGNDIVEGKKTLMTIHAARNASSADVARLEAILDDDETRRDEIVEVLDILQTTGSVKYAIERAHEFKRSALDQLERVDLDDEPARKLAAFTRLAVERDE